MLVRVLRLSNIIDGLKVMDGSQGKENRSCDCRDYKSVFESDNKAKLDNT